jgi:hypothetical protein
MFAQLFGASLTVTGATLFDDNQAGYGGMALATSVRKQVRYPNFHGLRQRANDDQRWIAFSSLNPANIGPMMVGTVRQLLLAPATGLAKFTDTLAKLFPQGLHTAIGPCYSP